MKALKYLSVLSAPLMVLVSFEFSGWLTWLPLLYAFVAIPMAELLLGTDAANADKIEEEIRKQDRFYDLVLYLVLPVYFGFLVFYLPAVLEDGLSLAERLGRATGMGLLCGLFGINVAHELGHRTRRYEKWMAQALLASTQYLHFFIEHNEGHHRNVSTPEDPASARFGETLYGFWIRSIVFSYRSAWEIETKRLKRKKKSFWSVHNRMFRYTLVQLAIIAVVFWFGDWKGLVWYSITAIFGILLLETINYIEHYGLSRNRVSEHRYEDASPAHSWNSDHIVGRLMLFELSRHSDHHYDPSRHYQILRHHDESPQMPTGYPGMMVLATIPPLWFAVMNGRIKREYKALA